MALNQNPFKLTLNNSIDHLRYLSHKLVVTQGKVSRDFLSHMVTSMEWRNGFIHGLEEFKQSSTYDIISCFPLKGKALRISNF